MSPNHWPDQIITVTYARLIHYILSSNHQTSRCDPTIILVGSVTVWMVSRFLLVTVTSDLRNDWTTNPNLPTQTSDLPTAHQLQYRSHSLSTPKYHSFRFGVILYFQRVSTQHHLNYILGYLAFN
jgi:hypothetical protein